MKKMIVSLGLALIACSAFAAKIDGAPGPVCEGLKIASGPAGKGYSNIYADIEKACGKVVPVCEVQTTGGLDNLNSLSTKKADVGFAQVDTWASMKSDENIAGLQAVAGLNFNYLHVVVSSTGFVTQGEKRMGGLMKGADKTVVIQRFSDLRGQRVAMVGSASLLGRQLDRINNYNMVIVDVDKDAAAFEMVKKGEVAAVFTVSSWPSGTIDPLTQKSGLTLVPFDIPANNPNYFVRPLNYKNMGVYNNNSLAIPNVLFTRPFKGEKAAAVAALKQCISDKLEDLKEGDYQPAWNEIKSLDNTADVPKFVTTGTTKGKK